MTQDTTEFERLLAIFAPLYSEIHEGDSFPERTPLLAHYTSIASLERILATDQLWFSNPLLMNDSEELRFGMLEGSSRFMRDPAVAKACGSEERADRLFSAYQHYFDEFSNEHALDVYALCLAEHNPTDTDGLLSMWRGYGGNGSGAAIVFDTAKLGDIPDSPLIIAKVEYASADQRREFLSTKVSQFAKLLEENAVPDEQLHKVAWIMFERIKVFALFTKHHGFLEEQEWRVVYLKDRDREGRLSSMLHYSVADNGLAPRLKFDVKPMDGVTTEGTSLVQLIDRIILGPTASSPLKIATLERVLEATGKAELKNRVVASTIPYRSS